MKDTLRLTDISTAEGQMVSIDLKDIPDVEGLDLVKMPWKPVTDEQKAKVACILDEVCVLNIPKPQTPQEEEELVNRFLDGMRKLFSKENHINNLYIYLVSLHKINGIFLSRMRL